MNDPTKRTKTAANNVASILRSYPMQHSPPRKQLDDIVDILSIQRILGMKIESFNSILDELPVYLWMHDENHTVVYGNDAFKETFGTYQKQTCYQCLMGKSDVCSCCRSQKTLPNKIPAQCKICKRGNSGYDINIFHMPITNKDGQQFILKSSLHINDLMLLANTQG